MTDEERINECRMRLDGAQKAFGQLSQVLTLAGNEVRLKILFLLEEEDELCVCDLGDILGMSVPAVSQHLRKLRDGNVIQARKSGQTIFYSLKKEHLEIIQPLFQHLFFKKGSMTFNSIL